MKYRLGDYHRAGTFYILLDFFNLVFLDSEEKIAEIFTVAFGIAVNNVECFIINGAYIAYIAYRVSRYYAYTVTNIKLLLIHVQITILTCRDSSQ